MIEFESEFNIFKIIQLIRWFDKCDNIYRQEFFELMKQKLQNIHLNKEEISNINLQSQNEYYDIINSYSFLEFELLGKIRSLESTYNNMLKDQKTNIRRKTYYQKNVYEERINLKKN